MAGLKTRPNISAVQRRAILDKVHAKSTPDYKQYVKRVAVPDLPKPEPRPLQMTKNQVDPWKRSSQDQLLANSQENTYGPNSPLGQFMADQGMQIGGGTTDAESQWDEDYRNAFLQRELAAPGSSLGQYLERENRTRPATIKEPETSGQGVLLQNRQTGEYVMVGRDYWERELVGKGLEQYWEPVMQDFSLYEDEIPYPIDSYTGFTLEPPPEVISGTAGSPPVGMWDQIAVPTGNETIPPPLVPTTAPGTIMRAPKISQSRRRKSTQEQRELARYFGLIK